MDQPRLNDEAENILELRQRESRFRDHFNLVFLGDTHIGKTCRCNSIIPAQMYSRLLQRVLEEEEVYRDILCIIHGGDATNIGRPSLAAFVKETRELLGYDQPSREDRIPFFANIGNHEYLDDPEGRSYQELIGDPGQAQLVWLTPQKMGIVLLDTGPGDRGDFPDRDHFEQELLAIEGIIRNHRDHQFVIDMHIPPTVGPNRCRYLTLNRQYTRQFTSFLDRNLNLVAAVVTHHRHCVAPSALPYYYRKRLPIYLTAYGGHCDCPRFACLRLSFASRPFSGWSMKAELISLQLP